MLVVVYQVVEGYMLVVEYWVSPIKYKVFTKEAGDGRDGDWSKTIKRLRILNLVRVVKEMPLLKSWMNMVLFLNPNIQV